MADQIEHGRVVLTLAQVRRMLFKIDGQPRVNGVSKILQDIIGPDLYAKLWRESLAKVQAGSR